MDDYLSDRRQKDKVSYYDALKENTTNFFERIKMVFKKEDTDFEEQIDVQANFEEEKEQPEKKLSLFSRIFRFKRAPSQEDFDEEYDDYQQENLEQSHHNFEEYKDAIKILHKWVEKLPESELKKFKASPDFEKYKTTLKKIGMIK